MNSQQQAFEKWYSEYYSEYALKSWNGEYYSNFDTELAWGAWRTGAEWQSSENQSTE